MRGLPIATALLLAACSGDLDRPRHTGGDPDDLRRSPCACRELPQHWDDGERDRLLRELTATDGRTGAA